MKMKTIAFQREKKSNMKTKPSCNAIQMPTLLHHQFFSNFEFD
jgi:hypothetical protein